MSNENKSSAPLKTAGVSLAEHRANRIYVAGPMTGLPDFNFPAFNTAANELRAEGWHVENPAEHGILDGAQWSDYMHTDLQQLSTCCAIYLLPGWSKSRGATLEAHVAQALGMAVYYAPNAETQAVAPRSATQALHNAAGNSGAPDQPTAEFAHAYADQLMLRCMAPVEPDPQAVAAQAAPAAPDANRLRAEILEHASKASRLVRTLFNEPTGTLSDVEVGDWIQRAQQYLSLATPALPATEDSSAGDLAEGQPEPVAEARVSQDAAGKKTVELELRYGDLPSGTHLLYTAPQAQPADAPTAYLQESDQHLLHRFIETTEDDESFDIGKDAVKRLANLGVVESCGFGRYGVTMFGYWVHEHYWHQNPSLPLKTNADRDREHRAAMAAAQEGGTAIGGARPQTAFQQRVQPWMMECFGAEIAADRIERNHRFLEEALELVQATGCTKYEAFKLVNYVFKRPVGKPAQEVGGVMVTLAAHCLANGLDMQACAETELARIWTKVPEIRAKQAAKPKHSPLPMAQDADPLDEISEALHDYHYALDTRQHGGVAAGTAINAIEAVLDMHWQQGQETNRRAAIAAVQQGGAT